MPDAVQFRMPMPLAASNAAESGGAPGSGSLSCGEAGAGV